MCLIYNSSSQAKCQHYLSAFISINTLCVIFSSIGRDGIVNDFGRRLENLREKNGYTKKEISYKLGFTANVYGSYERGDRRPSLETIIKLAELYDVSLDYLIRGKEYQNETTSSKNTSELELLIRYFNNAGFKHPYVLQLEKWEYLNEADFQELSNHFEWVVNKAKKRE